MGLKINPETGTIQNQEGGGITLDPGTNELVTIANGVMFPDGTAAEPGVRFSDDTNTGIYSPINDTVAFAGHGADIARFKGVTGAVNYMELTPSTTGQSVSLSVEGDDPNITLSLTGKGSGDVTINNIAFPISDGTVGQVLKTDGSNNLSFSTLDYNDLANLPTLVTDLSGLSDANITTPGTNQVLKYNGSAFVNASVDYSEVTNTPSVPSELSTLTDINTAGLQQGWSLKYLNDKWVPRQDWTIDATIGRPVIADQVYGTCACIGNTAQATVQGVTVTFDITASGTVEFAQTAANAQDMAEAINRDLDAAGELRVVAYHNAGQLFLVHSEGQQINLGNLTNDGSGNLVFTNGGQSCTGFSTSGVPRSTKGTLKASIGGIYNDLEAGTNGQVLKANSATTTGLEWTAFSYNDLADTPATFTPTAHTHVKADITDFNDADYATAAQGATADTALQAGDPLGLLGNVDLTGNAAGKILEFNGTNFVPIDTPTGGGSSTFTALTDTPADFTGQANKLLAVNVGETALEYIDAPSGGGASTLGALTDVTIAGAGGVSARYWRIQITENFGDANYTGIEEIQFRTSIGGADIATGGSVLASSFTGGFEASKAFDNNTTTNWFTGAGQPFSWIQYDLGAGNEAAVVEYTIEPKNQANRQPRAWDLQYSNDGTNFTTLSSVPTIDAWGSYEQRTFSAGNGLPNAESSAQFLVYDTATSVYTNRYATIDSLGGLGTPSEGDVISYVTGSWTNAPVSLPYIDVKYTVAASAPGSDSIAIGHGASSAGTNSIAIGRLSDANQTNGVAIGETATTNLANAIAIGDSIGSADSSIAIGNLAYTWGTDAIAIGKGAGNLGGTHLRTVSIGAGQNSTASDQVNIGTSTTNRLKYEGGKFTLNNTQAQFVVPSYTTAGRPTSPETGSHVFDTTLGKPIWHNGTNWVDATGATV